MNLNTLVKIAGVLTAIEFLLAISLYFRCRGPFTKRLTGLVVAVLFSLLHLYNLIVHSTSELLPNSIALALLGFSQILFWGAIRAHGSNNPAVVFSENSAAHIVDTGPYALIRHPFYLSYCSAFLACAAACHSVLLYLSVVVIFYIYNVAAAQEEKDLAEHENWSGHYQRYIARTWRWLPYVW